MILAIWLSVAVIISALIAYVMRYIEDKFPYRLKYLDDSERQVIAIGIGILWPMMLIALPFVITGACMYFLNDKILKQKKGR